MTLFPGHSEPATGQHAPDFCLPDQDGRQHCLADYRGDWLVIYFYPRDDTSGCTTEAREFQANYDYFRMTDIKLLGISTDSAQCHAAFRRKYELGFPLLSDRGGKVAKAYGSYFGIGRLGIAKRHSFIVDPQGIIVRAFRQVDPREHPFEVIKALHALTSGE